MKKRIAITACIVTVLSVLVILAFKFNIFSPSKGKSPESLLEISGSSPTPIINEDENNSPKQTLLIYMIGSDLESRSGAGTEDLKELESGSIDLKNVNVIVYAGGSPKWHNDVATSEKNTILQLTEKGFKTVKSDTPHSMGTAESLSEFLNYGYTNYPADSYALIMWDHGNGPVIGYGKDMLFGDDSLTLSEMKEALSSSPFNGANKLSWVGFDACLMSSAELVCIWDDYAEYLVASQEIEPSFGWNYKIFGSYGKSDTAVFLSALVDKYISTCKEYYKKKGYADRDTTLACMNLAYGSELDSAINDLFEKAGESVTSKYDTFALKRVETRALGRSSTGSEYDLVDLNDMAVQLGDLYPDETKALQNVISKMVIKNGSTAEGCSGLSLYYPFYNKYYYENSWGSTYESLGIFPSYGAYIDSYDEIWLKNDKLMHASSSVPESGNRAGGDDSGKLIYTLGLTKDQNETFADAKFYIMKKISNDLYHPVMSSGNVTNNNGILTAEYDGKAIYAVDSYGRSWIPVTQQHDTVDNITRYTVPAVTDMHTLIKPDMNFLNYHLEVNNDTKEIAVTALLPREKAPSRATLTGGKLEEVNEDDFSTMSFVYSDFLYLTRYDNNAVKPISEWIENGGGSWLPFAVKDKIGFEYRSLDADQYYIIFEITDTQGGKYCSEPLQTYIEPSETIIKETPVDVINWTEGDEICVYNANGIELYLKKDLESRSYYNENFEEVYMPTYRWAAKNNNDFPVRIAFSGTILNSSIDANADCLFTLDANSSEDVTDAFYSPYVWNIDMLCGIGALDKIDSVEGILSATNDADKSTILYDRKTKINISGEASLGDLSNQYRKIMVKEPYMGALAEEQILFEDNEARITLLYFGKSNMYSPAIICYENLSDEKKEIVLSSISINGVTVDSGVPYPIYPHSKFYNSMSISDLERNGIAEISNVSLTFGIYDEGSDSFFGAPDKTVETEISFKESAESDASSSEENIIYNENGIKMSLEGYGVLSNGSSSWIVNITNNSDEDVYIKTDTSNVWIGASVKKGQQSRCDINVSGDIGDKVSFKPIVYDITATKLLFTSKDSVTLYTENVKSNNPIQVKMGTEEKTKILEHEDIIIYLKNKNYADKSLIPDYHIEIQNNSDMNARIHLRDITLNGNIFLRSPTEFVYSKQTEEVSIFSEAREYTENGFIDEIQSISFTVEIEDSTWSLFRLTNQDVTIRLNEKELHKRTIPDQYGYDEGLYLLKYTYKPIAKKQVLYEDKSFRATLVSFRERNDGRGKDYSVSYIGYIMFENLSPDPIEAKFNSFYINDIKFSVNTGSKLPGNTKHYIDFRVYEHELIKNSISSLEKVEIDLNAWYDVEHDYDTPADTSIHFPIVIN